MQAQKQKTTLSLHCAHKEIIAHRSLYHDQKLAVRSQTTTIVLTLNKKIMRNADIYA